MVVFVCGSCNDSLKKNGVGVHLSRCRPAAISCCDCGKEFADETYREHTQCITEDAKYGPQDQMSRDTQDKGQKKQNDWLNNIKQALTKVNLSGPAEMALNKLLEYPNIPRKKAKFVNFTRDCVQVKRNDIVEQLWSICESANKATAENEQKSRAESNAKSLKETPQSTDEVTEDSKTSKKKDKKKRKKEGDEEPETGLASDDQEQSGKSNQVQDKENSSQSNGVGENSKKSKKKKKKESEEDNQENHEKTDETIKGDEENDESSPKADDDQQEESNLDQTTDKSKKSKKKKKRNHSEVLETDQVAGNSDESESRKKPKTEKTTPGQKMDQESNDDQSDPNSSELKNDSDNQINWFKQLKRLIKEKQTMDMKEFKKLLKRLKKDHNLDEDFSNLFEKSKVKLMKRHNYSVSEGQIKYQHLF